MNSTRRTSRVSCRFRRRDSSVSAGAGSFTRSSSVTSALSLFVTSVPAAVIPDAMFPGRFIASAAAAASFASIAFCAAANDSPTSLKNPRGDETSSLDALDAAAFDASSSVAAASGAASAAAASASASASAAARNTPAKFRIFDNAPASSGSCASSTCTTKPWIAINFTAAVSHPTTKFPRRTRTPSRLSKSHSTTAHCSFIRNGAFAKFAAGELPIVSPSTLTVFQRRRTLRALTSGVSIPRSFVSACLVTYASNARAIAPRLSHSAARTSARVVAKSETSRGHGRRQANAARRPRREYLRCASSITRISAAAAATAAAACSTESATPLVIGG
eukprot:31398-Pelagococcus_subviridis.AAC.8